MIETWAELQEEIIKAVASHAPRKSLRRRAVLLRALAMREDTMNETEQWHRDHAAMAAIEGNASWIAEHAKRMEAAARLLPETPRDAVGPVRELREAAQQVSVTLALLKSLIERYEPKQVFLTAAE